MVEWSHRAQSISHKKIRQIPTSNNLQKNFNDDDDHNHRTRVVVVLLVEDSCLCKEDSPDVLYGIHRNTSC